MPTVAIDAENRSPKQRTGKLPGTVLGMGSNRSLSRKKDGMALDIVACKLKYRAGRLRNSDMTKIPHSDSNCTLAARVAKSRPS